MGFAFFQRIAAPARSLSPLGAILGSCAAGALSPRWRARRLGSPRPIPRCGSCRGTVDLDGEPTLVAGIQLRMDPGWKTYWKNPGDSGVPPSFDWSGSKNLKHAEVLYPAPHRFADANGTAIGYDDEVVFPVKLTPERPGEPIELKLAFAYGLCKDLCIPNDVSLGLRLRRCAARAMRCCSRASSRACRSRRAPACLPSSERGRGEARWRRRPSSSSMRSFRPARPAPISSSTAAMSSFPVPKPLGPLADGKQRFAVNFVSPAEAAAIKGKTLALTLVSDQGSTETVVEGGVGRWLGRYRRSRYGAAHLRVQGEQRWPLR